MKGLLKVCAIGLLAISSAAFASSNVDCPAKKLDHVANASQQRSVRIADTLLGESHKTPPSGQQANGRR